MATVTFNSMVPEASPYLTGCPDLAIENMYRTVARELCSRARVWRGFLTPITMVVNTYTYAPATPLSYAELISVRDVTTIINNTKRNLKFATYEAAESLYPAWPEATTGDPQLFTRAEFGTILLAPVPLNAGTLKTYGDLRPTASALIWDADMYNEHRDCLFHGVLHRLLLMPNRPWTNKELALYHGKQWDFRLNAARARADQNYNTASVSVQMRPLA